MSFADVLGLAVSALLCVYLVYALLRALVRHRGRLMTHRALLVEVWGPQYGDDTQVLRAHIANLRRKIEPPGERRYIRTDAGVGYRFAA